MRGIAYAFVVCVDDSVGVTQQVEGIKQAVEKKLQRVFDRGEVSRQ